jgi:UDP-glucose 4-epimerase
MRILLTGASGFAGSHVARELASAGHRVTGTYRRDSPFLRTLQGIPDLNLVNVDIAGVCQLAGPFDAIVHAAATSPAPGISSAQIVRDNLTGFPDMLDAAERWGSGPFVFFSSLSLYGEVSGPVLYERCPVINPDAYGATKYLSETLLAERADRLPSVSLRLPGVLGPGAHRNWLSNAAGHIMAGRPVRAFNLDGGYNNAVHVSDLAAFIHRLVEKRWTGADSVVLGARGIIPFREVVERLARGLEKSVRIEPIAPTKPAFTLSSQRAITRWGYDPMEIGAMIDRYATELRSACL